MKSLILLSCASFILLPNLTPVNSHPKEQPATSLSCAAPLVGEVSPDYNGKYINVLPGWGKHSYKISSSVDSAQFYFNQGLNLYYSYHLKQALASFKEAARFDSSSAMSYWGEALAMGPYYNDPGYKMSAAVPGVIQQMIAHRHTATAKEKALIDAMTNRYSNDFTNADRAKLDHAYADAMASLVKRFPEDTDIKSLYVDAIMLQHKWDFWHTDGSSKAWTSELVKYCEEIIQADPNHPAGLHYYIHVTEASRHPERALRSADVLKDVMPGTAHMVHMASHMYQRNGLFKQGVDVNEAANTANNIADSMHKATGPGQNSSIHYFAVQSYCALSAGMYASAKPVYDRLRKRVIELNGPLDNMLYGQFVYSIPTFAAIRAGKWKDIQGEGELNPKWIYATIMQHFAKGLADLRQNNHPSANQHLEQIGKLVSDTTLLVARKPFNKPVQTCRIAEELLHAEILAASGSFNEAVSKYEAAISLEDNLIYAEPQDWMLPVRQYYGNFLLKNKKPKDAESIFRKDLEMHPGNGWSLLGLYQSLVAQKKATEAASVKKLYESALSAADVKPTAAVF